MSSTALTSPRTIYGRGLLTFTLVWQMAWLAFDPQLWPNNQSHIVDSVFIAGAMLTAVLLIIDVIFVAESSLRRRVLIWANLTMLTASALTLLLGGDRLADGWVVGSTFVILATGVAALVLPLRQSVAYIVSIAVIEGVLLTVVGVSVVDVVLYPVYALAVGAGMASAAFSLRRAAARVDIATASAEAVMRSTELDRELRDDAEAAERGIHDVVLNTLNAVARGGLTGRELEIRNRCFEAASMLRSLIAVRDDENTGDIARARMDEAIGRLRASGVEVDVGNVAPMPLPMQVRAAILGAAAEAFRNIELHAGASHVRTSYTLTPDSFFGVIEDDGCGFEVDETKFGYGITNSMRRALERVGGTVEIESKPGGGTKVTIRWSSDRGTNNSLFAGELADAFSVFVPSIAISFGALTLLSAAFTWNQLVSPWLAFLDLLVYLGLLTFVILRSRVGRGLGWVSSLIAIVAAIVVYRVQVLAIPADGATAWTDWGSEAVIAVFIIVIVAGPKWVWPVSILGWVIAQGGDPFELLRPGTGVLIASTFLAFSLRRQYATYDSIRTSTAAAEVERVAAAEAARIRAERYGLLLESPVVDLLDNISAGSVSPHDPLVREQCRIEERYVRTMMRLDPSSDAVHALVAELASEARGCGRELDVGVYGSFTGVGNELRAYAPKLRDVVRNTPGREIRITASEEGATVVVRLVATAPRARGGSPTWDEMTSQWGVVSPEMSSGRDDRAGSLVFTRDPDGSDDLWEVIIANANTGERIDSAGHR